MTGYMHDIFLRHACRIGYPFEPLVPAGHPANFKSSIVGKFVPVIADLSAYERLLNEAADGSHLAAIRAQYSRVCATAEELGADEW